MPGWTSRRERECRTRLETLKTRYARSAASVDHPCLQVREKNLEIARENIRRHDWARRHYEGMVAQADHYAGRTAAWIQAMVPDLTPLHVYGTFCPVCEGDNTWGMRWDYRDPEKLLCVHCGAVMTDRKFPEEGRLELPRSGQTLSYYLRPGEKGNARFSSGRNAFTWAGRRVHTSFRGAIRQQKIFHMTGVARTLALLYRMTGEDRYARTAAAVLKRFAAVYPKYLFHDYWNTFLDCDPLYACECMAEDRGVARYEVNACPDQNGRSGMKSGKLIQTFWGCGRMTAGGVHHEARLLGELAGALDLLWDARDGDGRPFLTEADRETVVRDLLVEGLFTFTHWKGINNKVAGCRVGEVALGRFLGLPEYVHKGVEGFEPYLEGFFKFDGSTAEGSGYYLYAVSNVRDLPEVAHGYSDPPSYRRKDRYDNLDLYRAAFHTVLRARALMTLPDGRVPHTADAHKGPPGWPAPTWIHNLGLVRLGNDFAPFVRMDHGDDFAFFNRPAKARTAPAPAVRDVFFPGWLLAVFNTGYEGMFREDLAGGVTFLMNFYEPDGHDHNDALNISMFVEGAEVLSDLGYIGDHPLNASLRSSFKHNLVVIDEKEQSGRGRRPPGNVRLLAASPHVKFIEADCKAYDEAETYRRACLLIHRAHGPAYLVDCFRVRGGKTHDYAIHGEGRLTALPTVEKGAPIPLASRRGVLGGDIEDLRVGKPGNAPWSAAWTEGETTMRLHVLSPTGEVILGEGPGQRDHAEIGARHDYLFVRNRDRGSGNAFVTVLDHARGRPDIADIRPLLLPPGAEGPLALEVVRGAGADTVLQSPDGSEITAGNCRLSGRVAVYTRERNGRTALFLAGARTFSAPDLSVTLCRAELAGEIAACDQAGFRVDTSFPPDAALSGAFVQVEDPEQGCWTAYTIREIRDRALLVDLFPFHGGARFYIPSVFWLDQETDATYRVRTTAHAEIDLRTRYTKAVWEQDGRQIGVPRTKLEEGRLVVQVDPRMLNGRDAVLHVG